MHRSRQTGFTLIELLVVIAVLGIIAAMAAPSFSEMVARRRVEGAVAEMSSDLQYARSQAVSDNDTVTFATGSTTGYTITGTGSRSYKTITLPSGVSATSGVSIAFMAMRGCVTDNTCTAADKSITVSSSATTESFTLTVNRMGKPAICSVGSAAGGYSKC